MVLPLLVAFAGILRAQLTTGIVEGVLRDALHHPVGGAVIVVQGEAGLRTAVHTDPQGRFTITLPYGNYSFSSATVTVVPLRTTHIELTTGSGGIESTEPLPGFWLDDSKARTYPEGFSLAAVLQDREPASVVQPLNFTGLADSLLSVESQGGISWTETRFNLEGLNATDSYQPGHPEILPNVADMAAITLRSGFSQSPSANVGTEAGLFLSQPGSVWHTSLMSADTGSPLAASTLPSVNRGPLQQDQYFRWLTRDGLETGGPIGHRADVFASAWGQWADQTEPLQAAGSLGSDQRSRLLFANVRGRLRVTERDQLDALYLGSRIDLSSGGMPVAIEALAGNRMSPSFTLPGGFPGQEEVDHFDFIQTGWSHVAGEHSLLGMVQVRYGYSRAHQDSGLSGQGPARDQSRVELTTGVVTGAPPLGNFAIRTRQNVQASWQPRNFSTAFIRHRVVAGGGGDESNPRNRFSVLSNMNLITANGVAVFVTDFNTPTGTSVSIRNFSGYLDDQMRLASGLAVTLGVLAEQSTGSADGVSGALISWNSLSPRAALAWNPLQRFTISAAWSRLYSPLAGRYLDYGNPNSLSGQEYQWNDANHNGWFDPGERGALLMRFGGAYSSISPTLRQPYAGHFEVDGSVALAPRTTAGIRLFRMDGRRRIAALDTGVPTQDFSPVTINDPGPDGITGTFDDRPLTVYAQNPATLGQDRYLLTNPAGLDTRNFGFVAEAGTTWQGFTGNASFTAEKSHAATNPGNAIYENDPGILGSLLLDLNTSIKAANRIFVDRAYVGKLYGTYRLPWLGIELANTATYMDGLAFARELLVTGMPQGPFMVDATVRGSPEGGNRAEHIVNWNAGLRRAFRTRAGLLTASLDLMNVINAGSKIQESALTSPAFNLRMPLAIQPPRSLLIGFSLGF